MPREPVQPLQRPHGLRPRRLARWTWLMWFALGGVVVLLVPGRVRTDAGPDCRTAARELGAELAVPRCRAEYDAMREPRTGARLAEMLRRTGDRTAATALANQLLSSEARADALAVLGKLAYDEGRDVDAETALRAALELHRAGNEHVAVARDEIALTGVLEHRGDRSGALRLLDDCVLRSRFLDPPVHGYCHMTAAHILLEIGNFKLADVELRYAEPTLFAAPDQARLQIGRGDLYQEIAREPMHETAHEQATQAFDRARVLAMSAYHLQHIVTADRNLAYTLAERGMLTEAQVHLDLARAADAHGELGTWPPQLQANIEFHRGNLDRAWSLNEAVYPTLGGGDRRMDVAVMQARIALARGELDHARDWAQRGVDTVEKIRADAPPELRPWLLTTRREPYELLFLAYARAGRALDALLAFDRWQARGARDAIAGSLAARGRDLRSAADAVEQVTRWVSPVAREPVTGLLGWIAPPILAEIDLLAIVIAEGDVWCVTAQHGEVRLHDVGSAHRVRELVGRLVGHPEDRAVASELGAMLLPDGIAHTARDALHLLVDAPLAGLPAAALIADDGYLIAARPIVYVDQLPTHACDAPRRPAHAAVVADATRGGDLPEALGEAIGVAALLDTAPVLGAHATSGALFATPRDAVLHLAVHGDVGYVRLHDRDVTALEISAHSQGPELVVMSTCESGAAGDPEATGSVAAAFVAAGSRHVVAATRRVTDRGAAEVMTRFYRAGGVLDPVRALAAAQAELARTSNRDWARFAVYGRDVCLAH